MPTLSLVEGVVHAENLLWAFLVLDMMSGYEKDR